MKIEDIKIGMKVRIREWDDMEKEHGLNSRGVIPVRFCFMEEMRRFCGVCAEVVSIKGNMIKLSEQFESPFGRYAISADMLEPAVEEFTMPPPPELGELHGVKLPAWMWNRTRGCSVYAIFYHRKSAYVAYVHDGGFFHSRGEYIEPYTGQDMQPKHSVDDLKSLARLVNNVR